MHPFHYPCLEEELQTFTNLQGGCERIKATPIPFSYNVLMHRIVGIYCVTLPFVLLKQSVILHLSLCRIVSYAFLGLDAIGEEIENPFGRDPNDLPLNYISTMIEMNLMQRIDLIYHNFRNHIHAHTFLTRILDEMATDLDQLQIFLSNLEWKFPWRRTK